MYSCTDSVNPKIWGRWARFFIYIIYTHTSAVVETDCRYICVYVYIYIFICTHHLLRCPIATHGFAFLMIEQKYATTKDQRRTKREKEESKKKRRGNEERKGRAEKEKRKITGKKEGRHRKPTKTEERKWKGKGESFYL